MKRVTVEFVFDMCGSCPHYSLDEQFCSLLYREVAPYKFPQPDCPLEEFNPPERKEAHNAPDTDKR